MSYLIFLPASLLNGAGWEVKRKVPVSICSTGSFHCILYFQTIGNDGTIRPPGMTSPGDNNFPV